MGEPAVRGMSVDAFFAWQRGQDVAASLALADICDELVFEPGHAPAR